MIKYRRFVLKEYPGKDFPQDLSCFTLIEDAVIDPNSLLEGQVLIKLYYVSLDPIMRTWISGAKSYLDPIHPNSGIPSFGIAKVVKYRPSTKDNVTLSQGEWIVGMLEWSEYMIVTLKQFQKIPIDLGDDIYKYLTIFGPTGLTSFISIKREIQPFEIWSKKLGRKKTKEELNIVVSSAAGGVGLTVIEYLVKMGYKNIYGIAGSQEKCKLVVERGCRAAINYKKYYSNKTFNFSVFEADLKKIMNDEQTDLYYENVGEDMLSAMLNLMSERSKIILCGALATYNNWNEKLGIFNIERVIFKRIEMKGIIYFHENLHSTAQMFMEMIQLDIKGMDVLIYGMEKLPETYRDMIDGKFIGKPLVRFL